MIHGQRVGITVPYLLELLVELHSIQLLCLLAGEVSGQRKLCPKACWCGLRPESRCGRALRPNRIIGSLLAQSLSL